jgi:hypothetical protein
LPDFCEISTETSIICNPTTIAQADATYIDLTINRSSSSHGQNVDSAISILVEVDCDLIPFEEV